MTPSAVRMVLVEGENADGPSLDHDAFDIPATAGAATSAAPQQVIDAILGTRESALEGGHRLTSIGVAWTDHAAAGKLRGLLRSYRMDDVVLVSELHAASALAQAIGQTVGYERTALLFVERETATLAVVRAADGAVVRVMSRPMPGADVTAELQAMVANVDNGPEPAQAVYVVGSDVDVAGLESDIASATTLPVHAPQDGDLALARGAALASASTPRYEASTVGLASTEDTAAGATQMAAAGYMAPLGYSAVADDDDEGAVPYDGPYQGVYDADLQPEPGPAEPRKSFILVGSALSGVFVVGVAALAVTLAVVIRPTADQRPTPGGNPVVSSTPAPVPAQAKDVAPPPAPETIQAPIPVVQEAPRTVVVAPQAPPPAPAPAAAPEPAPAPAAPPPAPEPAPAPPPPAPAPAPAPPPAPAPAPSPAAAPPPAPVIVPVPIVIPPIFQPPVLVPPAVRTPTYPTLPTYTAPSPTYTTPPPARVPRPTSTPPVTSYPTYTATPTTVAPSAGSSSSGSGGSGSGGSSSGGSSSSGSSGDGSSGSDSGGSKRSQSPLWPLWPFGG